ncbi:alpha/beta hydrolase [Gulosibacter molinativorax]|uniref:Alpha/beta hydrolase n=1 Tax=Gulosibacter molinativorax TaxID=256821 RepID=A0ABT7C6X1_9MICO|nr:alpha/beta hydrolase [Gulosibacter molinativorax]MDJ1370924.1 alpha/beta hydrolase [Gulosibacter molinativorax]QUY62713.1 Putative lipase/esterase [Gulosibacter molinativorax]
MQIPLSRVAADQRGLIAAFREAGGKSYQDASSVAESRANYERSCAANGLAPDAVAHVEDVAVGSFGVRVYDPRPARASASASGSGLASDSAAASASVSTSASAPGSDRSLGRIDGPTSTDSTGGAFEAASYRAAADPVIVFAHGGGWVIGSLETHDSVCRRIATLTGLPVVAIDYRLGPEAPFPAGHEDCRDAVAWVRDAAAERSWDANRIVTIGDSAGGGIAAVLASQPSMHVADTTVIGQVLLYPMLDVANESAGFARITDGVPLTAATIRWFVENYVLDEALRSDPRVSPLPAVTEDGPAQPPAWILSLGLDPLADEALEYSRRLALGGTHVELVHLPDHAHGLFTSAGKIATGERMLEQAADFILRAVAAAANEDSLARASA